MELYLKRRNKVRGLRDRHGEQFDRKLEPSVSQPIRNHTGLFSEVRKNYRGGVSFSG